MSAPGERIAVYGGSFDPPHAAHLLVASWVVTCAPVDRLVLVPTFRHAFAKETKTSFEHRVRMCELLATSLPRTSVSTIEAGLPVPSRTLDTLEALSLAHPGATFRLVAGGDIASETSRWHRWDAIVALAPPLWVGRAGYPLPDGAEIAFPEVSSTEIRRRLASHESVRGLVPNDIVEYIEAHGLYGA